MKKVIKGRYVDGAVHLLEEFGLKENEEVYIIVEGKEEKGILEETFGIWIDEPDYLEKLRKKSEERVRAFGIS
jgi:predicted DNA-binding antitoxin AbrB/MazE fold protein